MHQPLGWHVFICGAKLLFAYLGLSLQMKIMITRGCFSGAFSLQSTSLCGISCDPHN